MLNHHYFVKEADGQSEVVTPLLMASNPSPMPVPITMPIPDTRMVSFPFDSILLLSLIINLCTLLAARHG